MIRREREGLIHTNLSRKHAVPQYLSFKNCRNSWRGYRTRVKNSARPAAAALLNRVFVSSSHPAVDNLNRGPPQIGGASSLSCVCSFFGWCLRLLSRCVCSSPSLRLPAVPEGPADQTGVPDTFPPRRVSCCRRGLPHRHLSHLHRSVVSEFIHVNHCFMFILCL